MKVSSALKAVLPRVAPVLVLAVAATIVLAPSGVGFSTGMHKDLAPDAAAFAKEGCTACHGALHEYAAVNTTNVGFFIADADGTPLNGFYEAGTEYVITITLDEQIGTDEENRAGFNLRASAGELTGVDGESKVSGDGTEATHTGAERTTWRVGWTAPDHDPVVFTLFVNDVDGSGAPDADDVVYRLGFYVTDHDGAVPGAVAEEHVEFGISLQQYWIGLIGLAGMILIMVASFAYLKFTNPHNTDAKDR